MLDKKTLYGEKSAEFDYWRHMRKYMSHLEFESYKADPDTWTRYAVKPEVAKYWEYVLLYGDDAIY